MVSFFGDYNKTETVYIPFNTFSSDDPSASVTITNLANTDVYIHKDGSTTQRSSSSGITVSIDFDSITGNHLVAIDLSDDTDTGYYADGSRYQVRMEGTTVDGATINAWIGAFSIGCTLRPTTLGRTVDVTSTGAVGIDWGNVENQGTSVDLSATAIDLCDEVTDNTDMRGTDNALLAASAPTNFSDLAIAVTTGRVDVGSIEGSDATDQIRDSIVDDATLIDASALNILSGHDPGSQIASQTDITALNDFDNTSDQVIVSTNNDKTGYALSAAGIDSIIDEVLTDLTDSDIDSGASITLRKAVRAIFNRFFRKVTQTATVQTVYNDSDSAIADMNVSDDTITQTKGTT